MGLTIGVGGGLKSTSGGGGASAADVKRIQQTLGHYTKRDDIVLTAKETDVAISSDGAKVSKSGWAIAEFAAERGVEYLFRPATIDGSVCIFAQEITSSETRSIDYTYTYNDDGTVATAKATYNGKTHTYTYTYTYDDEGKVLTQTITDEGGTVVSALPYQYAAEVGTYLPMTRLNADAELPADGYCRLMSHFQGNASLKVVVSYKVGSADLTMLAVKDGVFASVATQLGNLSQNIASTQSALSEEERVGAALRSEVDVISSLYGDGQGELGGQPQVLFAQGTPQEGIVPLNWKSYDPDTDTGYNWVGLPTMVGQIYKNISASGGESIYFGYYDTDGVTLKWYN